MTVLFVPHRPQCARVNSSEVQGGCGVIRGAEERCVRTRFRLRAALAIAVSASESKSLCMIPFPDGHCKGCGEGCQPRWSLSLQEILLLAHQPVKK